MNVLVTGGTGFVGRILANTLVVRRDRVTIVTRDPGKASDARAGVAYASWSSDLGGHDAIVHLAGASIAGKRWTAAYKRELVSSRVDATRTLVERIGASAKKPRVLVSASAAGFYGDRGDELLSENAGKGAGFLSDLCADWEQEARAAEKFGVRVVIARFGIVLGRAGGALAQMLPIFRLGLGGPFGSGRAWFPWVHVEDVTGFVRFALDDAGARGVFNVCAPGSVTNKDFARTLGRVLSRPAILPVPYSALKIAAGEVASALIASERCVPERTLGAGFRFEHPDLEPALRAILGRS